MTDTPTPAPSTRRKALKQQTRSISVLLPVEVADQIDRIADERMIGRGLLVAKLITAGIAQLPST